MTLLLSPLLAVLAAGSGSRYPIPPSALGLVASDCTHAPFETAVTTVLGQLTSMGTNYTLPAGRTLRDVAIQHISHYCGDGNAGVCPAPMHIDVQNTCADHSVHSFTYDFDHAVSKRSGLMWQIFFLIMALILGAVRAHAQPHTRRASQVHKRRAAAARA